MKKMIKLIAMGIILTGCIIVGFVYSPVSMKVTVFPEKSKEIETISEIPDIIVPVSTEEYLNGLTSPNFTPYTMKDNASMGYSQQGYNSVQSFSIKRYLEVKFEQDKALYHSIGTQATRTVSVEKTKNVLTEVLYTFDFELYISKNKMLVKYNQWDCDRIHHDTEYKETEEDRVAKKVVDAIHKNYGKWIELPEIMTEEEIIAKAALANDMERELYILTFTNEFARVYKELMYRINDLNYEGNSFIFNHIDAHFSDFKKSESNDGFDSNPYYIPYYADGSNNKWISDGKGNTIPNEVNDFWKSLNATYGKFEMGMYNKIPTFYLDITNNINVLGLSQSLEGLIQFEDINNTKIDLVKGQTSFNDLLYE
ncbi:MAG: hypothetical protein NC310_01410, partial [Roseburia sp.]|nr:hypothetical protein [Roseburia sp.]